MAYDADRFRPSRIGVPGGSHTGRMSLALYSSRDICHVPWTVELHETFVEELAEFDEAVRIAILGQAKVLQEFGPRLGRPYVDTLYGSAFTNMKELRCDAEK